MNVQEFFYWTLSIAAILFGLFLIVAISTILYLRSLARKNMDRIAAQFDDFGRTWRNLAMSRFIIRILKLIF